LGHPFETVVPTEPFPVQLVANGDGSEIYYIVTGGSSLLKNNGEENICLDPFLRSFGIDYFFVSSLTSLSQDCDTLLISAGNQNTFEQSLFKSDDGGRSWRQIPCPFTNATKFFVDPSDQNLWVAVHMDGTIVTYDGGLNWFRQNMPNGSTRIILDKVFFSTAEDTSMYGLFMDYSEINAYVCKYDYRLNQWDFTNRYFDLIGELDIANGQVKSFNKLSNGEFIFSVYSPDPFDENFLSENVYIYNSNWEQVANTGAEFYDQFDTRILLEDSANPGIIYSASPNLYKSDDYGRTWTIYSAIGLPDLMQYRIEDMFQPHNSPDLYLTIRNNGLYRSQDGGSSWEQIEIMDIGFVGRIDLFPNNLTYSTYGSTSFYKRNEDRWQGISFNNLPDYLNIFNTFVYCNNDTMIMKTLSRDLTVHPEYGNRNRLKISFDGGQTWNERDNENAEIIATYQEGQLNLINPLVRPNVFAISTDLGETWEERFRGSQLAYSENFFYSIIQEIDHTYTVSRMGINSSNWIPIYHSFDELPRFIKNLDDNLFVATPTGECSFNFGNGWINTGFLPDFDLVEPIMFEVDETLYIGHMTEFPATIYLSSDTARTWMEMEVEFPYSASCCTIYDFRFDAFRNRIWLDTQLGQLWTPFESMVQNPEDPIQLQPVDPNLFTNYPNPFNASTCIQYNLTKPGNVKLDLFDITGRLVKTLENTDKPAGRHNIYIDGSGLSSGTYLVRLNTGTEVRNKKISLVK